MLYCISKARYPMWFVSCGMLVNDNGFLHPARRLDTFVFLLITEGKLHIEQNGRRFDVKENQFFVLYSGMEHKGYKPSEGRLSYYWVHFTIGDRDYKFVNKNIISRSGLVDRSNIFVENILESYILPEAGVIDTTNRAQSLFSQLLDMARRGNYNKSYLCNYALSALLLEVTNGIVAYDIRTASLEKENGLVLEVIEWVRTNYDKQLTVTDIAARFGYHPSYLTSVFKKSTGHTVIEYINLLRITVAKNLLLNKSDIQIKTAAITVGIPDEKYFSRLFKKYAGLTPLEYKKTFFRKKVNST